MNNQNENNSIFENPNIDNANNNQNQEVINGKVNEAPKENINVVTPVVDKPDLADKTINAVESLVNTTDHQSEYTSEELKQYKTSAIISYIPFVSIILILIGKYKTSNYLKFHVNQGLILTIIDAIVIFITETITAIFRRDSLVLNSTPAIISFVCYTLYFILFLLVMFGIINTANGKSQELPIIGKFKLLK